MVVAQSTTSFKSFYKSIAFIYQILGVAPVYNGYGRLLRLITSCGLVLAIYYQLALYLQTEVKSQFLAKCEIVLRVIAFTAALVNPLWKSKQFLDIINLFNQIDNQLSNMKIRIDYKKHVKVFYIVTVAFLVMVLFYNGLGYYILIVKKNSFMWIWILLSIPLSFYTMSLHQAIFLIFCIHKRMQFVSALLHPHCKCVCPQYTADKQSEIKLFRIINDIYLLCGKVDQYFGPVILSFLEASFAVAVLHISFAFTGILVKSLVEDNWWMVFMLVYETAIHILLVFGISFAAELVYKDANSIITCVMRLNFWVSAYRNLSFCQLS